MNQYNKQFDVVKKIKAIVRLTGRAIRAHSSRHQISEEFARKIQKSAYDVSCAPKTEGYTPTYKAIAKQLQVRDIAIFRAAVYNLIEIAKQQAVYRDEIVKILEQQFKMPFVSDETKKYIEQKLADL